MSTDLLNGWHKSYREAVTCSRLRHELLRLLHGQQDIADRLVTTQKRLNPGHSESWYLDKVLYGLEQDT